MIGTSLIPPFVVHAKQALSQFQIITRCIIHHSTRNGHGKESASIAFAIPCFLLRRMSAELYAKVVSLQYSTPSLKLRPGRRGFGRAGSRPETQVRGEARQTSR